MIYITKVRCICDKRVLCKGNVLSGLLIMLWYDWQPTDFQCKHNSSYCSYSRCPRMKIFTSVLKGNVPSSLRKRYSSLASLNTGLLSQTKKCSTQFKTSRESYSNTFCFYSLVSCTPLWIASYRGEQCHGPWGAAWGTQQLLDLQLPCGSQANL